MDRYLKINEKALLAAMFKKKIKTHSELSKKSKIAQKTITNVFRTGSATFSTLSKLAEFLCVDIMELLAD